MSRPYTIAADGGSITCHRCGLTSHNANDVRERWCGKCHVFLDDGFPAIPACACPSCGHAMDHVWHPGDEAAKPAPGDISLCLDCGEALQFNPDMTQRVLTPQEFLALPLETRRSVIALRAQRKNADPGRT